MNLTALTKVFNPFIYDFSKNTIIKKHLGDIACLLSTFREDEFEIIKGQAFL